MNVKKHKKWIRWVVREIALCLPYCWLGGTIAVLKIPCTTREFIIIVIPIVLLQVLAERIRYGPRAFGMKSGRENVDYWMIDNAREMSQEDWDRSIQFMREHPEPEHPEEREI